MKRIAYIGLKGIPAKSGADRVAEAIISRVGNFGFDPVVYCDAAYTPKDTEYPGISLIRLPTIPGKHLRSTSLNIIAALHAIIVGNYDLIHLHNREASYILPLLRLRFKVVSTSHGGAYWRTKWSPISKWLMRLMDYPFMVLSNQTTSVSAKDSRELKAKFNRATRYIPNGVGSEYKPSLEKAKIILEKHGLSIGDYFIFVAGRIEPTKGAHLAIQAFNQFEKNKILIVGDIHQMPEYEKNLKEMSGKNIYFEPPIDDTAALFGLMIGSVSLIFPSFVEAMSMVLLEAASLGVPIICSDIEENRIVVNNNALYFNPGEVDDLTKRVSYAISNPIIMRKFGKNLKNDIRINFSWDTIVQSYIEIYESVIN